MNFSPWHGASNPEISFAHIFPVKNMRNKNRSSGPGIFRRKTRIKYAQ